MHIDFITLFPEVILAVLGESMMKRATASGIVQFQAVNPRGFCTDRHQKVDDVPFGGEPGMLIKPEPVAAAIRSLLPGPEVAVVIPSPAARPFKQADAVELASKSHLIFLCGHYEGFDHRIEERFATHLFSVGDYIVTNGELPSLLIADAVVRLLPGVLGDPKSLEADSHSDGLLSAPNFTRPEIWEEMPVPAVLRSGDHGKIAKWRREESLRLTAALRPDLLAKAELTKEDVRILTTPGIHLGEA
jgi:tRNA (guanine37-N1)-methyltransferase